MSLQARIFQRHMAQNSHGNPKYPPVIPLWGFPSFYKTHPRQGKWKRTPSKKTIGNLQSVVFVLNYTDISPPSPLIWRVKLSWGGFLKRKGWYFGFPQTAEKTSFREIVLHKLFVESPYCSLSPLEEVFQVPLILKPLNQYTHHNIFAELCLCNCQGVWDFATVMHRTLSEKQKSQKIFSSNYKIHSTTCFGNICVRFNGTVVRKNIKYVKCIVFSCQVAITIT